LKNGKKGYVANASLRRELDTAVARQVRVEFTWVKAHNGTLLNECADQLATTAVKEGSYGPKIAIPQGEREDEAEYTISSMRVLLRED
jgi:ribonuclease HI